MPSFDIQGHDCTWLDWKKASVVMVIIQYMKLWKDGRWIWSGWALVSLYCILFKKLSFLLKYPIWWTINWGYAYMKLYIFQTVRLLNWCHWDHILQTCTKNRSSSKICRTFSTLQNCQQLAQTDIRLLYFSFFSAFILDYRLIKH
jgi:hypothetical protein